VTPFLLPRYEAPQPKAPWPPLQHHTPESSPFDLPVPSLHSSPMKYLGGIGNLNAIFGQTEKYQRSSGGSITPIISFNRGSSAWDDGLTVLCANDFDKICRVGGDGHWRIPQKGTGHERKLRDLDSHAQGSSRHAQINITEHPTAQWTAQQIIEAFPFETAPIYVLRDRDGIYGRDFH